jgi:hypothetical protein
MQVFVHTRQRVGLTGRDMPMSSRHSVPAMVKPRFDEIVGPIEAVCRAHLTEEYGRRARIGIRLGPQTAVTLAPRPQPHGLRHHLYDRQRQLSV